MKMLSNTLPAPVQPMRMLADSSRAVKASDVNWAPWSLLKTKGLEQLNDPDFIFLLIVAADNPENSAYSSIVTCLGFFIVIPGRATETNSRYAHSVRCATLSLRMKYTLKCAIP